MSVGVGQCPYPDRKILLLTAIISCRKFTTALDKMVGIGIVSVVLPAFFPDFLVEKGKTLPVFAEVGAGDPESEKVIGRLANGMGKTHRDIRGRCLFVGDHDFQPLGHALGRQFQLRIESFRQNRKIIRDFCGEVGREAAGQSDGDVPLLEMLQVEGCLLYTSPSPRDRS